MQSSIRPISRIATAASCCLRPCWERIPFWRNSSPTPATRVRNSRRCLQKSCLASTPKSSSVPIRSKDLPFYPNAGSLSAPSLGSIVAEGLPKIGRISTARRSHSCALPRSASCSENSVIQSDVSGQTLRERSEQDPLPPTRFQPSSLPCVDTVELSVRERSRQAQQPKVDTSHLL